MATPAIVFATKLQQALKSWNALDAVFPAYGSERDPNVEKDIAISVAEAAAASVSTQLAESGDSAVTAAPQRDVQAMETSQPAVTATPEQQQLHKLVCKFMRTVNDLCKYAKSGGVLSGSHARIVELCHRCLTVGEFGASAQPLKRNIPYQLEELVLSLVHESVWSEAFDATEALNHWNEDILVRLIYLLRHPDPVEDPHNLRALIKTTVYQLYKKLVPRRPFMLQQLRDQLLRVIPLLRQSCECLSSPDSYAGTADVLEILTAIVRGFQLPLKPEHKKLFSLTILPLHQQCGMVGEFQTALGCYHQSLSHCTISFCEKEPELAVQTLAYMVRRWPEANSKQASLILDEMEDLLDRMAVKEWKQTYQTLVTHLAEKCIESPNFMIAQRAMLMLNRENVMKELFPSTMKQVCKILLPSVIKTADKHWNESSRQMAHAILKKLSEFDQSVAKMPKVKLLHTKFEEFYATEREHDARRKERQKHKKTDIGLLDFGRGRQLGQGSYSTVYHCTFFDRQVEQRHYEQYAFKVMNLPLLKEQDYYDNAMLEIKLLEKLDHPNIIKLIGSFQDKDDLYLVMEYAEKGDLFNLLDKIGTLDVACSRVITAEILVALEHLHMTQHVVHSDLKPENVLLDGDGHAKLTDFGSAREFDASELQAPPAASMDVDGDQKVRFEGTAEYLAPEIIDGLPAVPASDLWALGCVLFQMLAGVAPFNADEQSALFEKIRSGEYAFPESFDDTAQDLVRKLLATDPTQRIGKTTSSHTYEDIRAHPFFAGVNFDTLESTTPPEPTTGIATGRQLNMKLRQRKYSMMLTQAITRKYQYSSFQLEPIVEVSEEDDDMQ